MLIKVKKGWELPESAATPEHVFFSPGRRRFLVGAGAAAATIAAPGLARAQAPAAGAQAPAGDDPSASRYPAQRNLRYRLDRDVTEERVATTYNNFYEFGSSKTIWRAAQALPIRPWEIRIDGMVEEPRTVAIDDLLGAMQLEERLYRHRCVEAWAMAVPWTGFPIKDFIAWARPKTGAKYLRFETFMRPEIAGGQRASWYPWPYVEGITVEEGMNELSLFATGVYGKPLPKQMGAPIRLVTPWKYGFKAVKSIVRISFTDQRPVSFWEELQASEYGFWANVNPQVPHPRWSQATEELIGTNGRRVPTQLYNGYADQVAALYANLQSERLYM
jgi:sulfoxide reductase catalytic subunit YedY